MNRAYFTLKNITCPLYIHRGKQHAPIALHELSSTTLYNTWISSPYRHHELSGLQPSQWSTEKSAYNETLPSCTARAMQIPASSQAHDSTAQYGKRQPTSQPAHNMPCLAFQIADQLVVWQKRWLSPHCARSLFAATTTYMYCAASKFSPNKLIWYVNIRVNMPIKGINISDKYDSIDRCWTTEIILHRKALN